jgi:putative DNA-invertase from lambdoid prophage Rac
MSRTFAYARVSTADQSTENQVREIRAAGFAVDPRRTVTESVSGSVPAGDRPGFSKLLDRLEDGDVLIVTKLDRLGRNAMDLTTPAGRMTMQVLNAVAEFERDLLIERTNAGIERAKAEGKTMGRPSALTDAQHDEVRKLIAEARSVSELARQFKTSRTTIMRIRDKS